MNEATYQRGLIKRLRTMFPGCHVMKQDPARQQGVPDLLILHHHTWAMLEVKMDDSSVVQPNQEHYVQHFDGMSYAAFINPSNEEAVLHDLQQTFRVRGEARVP